MNWNFKSSSILVIALLSSSQWGTAVSQFGITVGLSDEVFDIDRPFTEIPSDDILINRAFPTWCITELEERIPCTDPSKGETNGQENPRLFNPIYLTKKFSGAAPALGGWPTNTDIQYVYEFAAPFLGQPGGGSSDQCPEDFPGSIENFKQCGKLNTENDSGPYGPGHVPPHIALFVIKLALLDDDFEDPSAKWFDFPTTQCRISTSILFQALRKYFPRGPDGSSPKYPPPFTDEGGRYLLEFVNKVGPSCASEKEKFPTSICFEEHSGGTGADYPDYVKQGGGPHYCSKKAVEADANDGWCPYIFFGPNRGKYRHPHIAFSALEVYLANIILPNECATTWDDSNFPAKVDTTVAWPVETEVPLLTNNKADFEPQTLFSPNQPLTRKRRSPKKAKGTDKTIYFWPDKQGFKKKPVVGNFANSIYVVE